MHTRPVSRHLGWVIRWNQDAIWPIVSHRHRRFRDILPENVGQQALLPSHSVLPSEAITQNRDPQKKLRRIGRIGDGPGFPATVPDRFPLASRAGCRTRHFLHSAQLAIGGRFNRTSGSADLSTLGRADFCKTGNADIFWKSGQNWRAIDATRCLTTIQAHHRRCP